MAGLTRKTDGKARVTLPEDFANCFVTIERLGDELRVRKARQRYSFQQLMAGVTKENLHAEIPTAPPQGKEAL